MFIKNAFKHFKLITKHRWLVFKLSIKAGIPFRGLIHDLSKYSLAEFIESSKFYVGYKSPIQVARQERQYSLAWLHHKGHNKHHEEYWYDFNAPIKAPIIPYKYAIEMICDNLSAGMVYNGKDFKNSYPLKYWNEIKNKELFHPQMQDFMKSVWEQLAVDGIDKTIQKKNLKSKYEKHCK